MASIAVLPVLIGLAVDYAIQFQARHDEVRRRPSASGERARRRRARRRGRRADDRHRRPGHGGRASWCCCSRPCRWCAASARWWCSASCWRWRARSPPGFAALVRFGGDRGVLGRAARLPARARARARRRRPHRGLAARAGRGRAAGGRIRIRAAERGERSLAYAVARPRRVLAVGLAVAIVGWAVDTQSEVVSDVRELVPRDLQALKDVNTLQDETGRGGRDRRDRPRRRHHPARGDRVDDQVPAGDAEGRRLHDAATPAARRRTRPSSVPALSLPDIFRSVNAEQPAADQHAARRRARLLLPGGGDQGPQDREPGVRHPAPVARGAEGGGRPDQGPARPARGRHGVGGGPAGAGRRRQRRALVGLAPRASP